MCVFYLCFAIITKNKDNRGLKLQAIHTPVLQTEVLKVFEGLDDGIFLDCTLGFSGHSKAILKAHKKLRLIACDKDDEALSFSRQNLQEFGSRVRLIKSDFKEILGKLSCDELMQVRGVLADIGVSSLHLDKDERGFSVHSNYLDMRMNQEQSLSAYELVNSYTPAQLEHIFKEFAELKDARVLAEKICIQRAKKPISSAKELAQIIGTQSVNGRRVSKAVLAFQAIRIEVNGELEALKQFLHTCKVLKNCTLAVISFHSLEDALVKNAFKDFARACICDEKALKCECGANHSLGRVLSKKPIVASEAEKRANSRSSCAKMRAFYFN